MNRFEKLQQDPMFVQLLNEIEAAEENRPFCRHGLPHLLDTARIAWIDALENSLPLDKSIVYAAALLHDLGRAPRYAGKGDHDTAALDDCRDMLSRSGYASDEIAAILAAVAAHGDKHTPDSHLPLLSALLRRADGASRNCWHCPAADECNWTAQRRNNTTLQ